MTESIDNSLESGWVYVFVCDPGPSESYLGLYDAEKDVNFIPVFKNKNDANDSFLNIPREKGKKYELQAVLLEELQEQAEENSFNVALVDDEGKVVKN